MPVYHVDIYRIIGKLELDIEAENVNEARKKAIRVVDTANFFLASDKDYLIEIKEYKIDGN